MKSIHETIYTYELHSRARAGQQPFSGVAVYSKSGAKPPIGPSSPESFASSWSSEPTELFLALGTGRTSGYKAYLAPYQAVTLP